jgi:transcriptional regulator with XRE-family HTH domain
VTTQDARARRRLGAEIARRRPAAGFETQPDLARAAGLSRRTVTALENGEKVSLKSLSKVEAAMGLPTDSLNDYIEHGRPLPASPNEASVPESPRHEWSSSERHRMRDMPMTEVQETYEMFRRRSEYLAEVWIREVMREKAAAEVRSETNTEREALSKRDTR